MKRRLLYSVMYPSRMPRNVLFFFFFDVFTIIIFYVVSDDDLDTKG